MFLRSVLSVRKWHFYSEARIYGESSSWMRYNMFQIQTKKKKIFVSLVLRIFIFRFRFFRFGFSSIFFCLEYCIKFYVLSSLGFILFLSYVIYSSSRFFGKCGSFSFISSAPNILSVIEDINLKTSISVSKKVGIAFLFL